MIGAYIYRPWKNVLPPGKHVDPLPETRLI
jgi:hypothetical protein